MNGEPDSQGVIPRDFDLFSGLDVDKTSISVTLSSHQGPIKSMRIPYSAKHLLNYIGRRFAGQKVVFAYEAGPTGYGLYDQLTAEGHRCLVVAPAMVPQARGQRVKTNRLDSRKLSEALRGGQLKSIHVPTVPYRHLRHLTQLRDTYVRQIAATKCRIKGLLLFEGIAFPKAPPGSQWSSAVINQLKALPASQVVHYKLEALLSTLQFAKRQGLDTVRVMRRFCREDPELNRCMGYLQSIPGIGWIVASHLLARIGDWRQLRKVREVGAFVGLVARENTTGDDVQRGPITRSGDSRLRSKLIQSAWAAIRKDPELKAFYQRIYSRHPLYVAARKAIVAVARKLTTRIYVVLRQQRPYVVRPV